MTNRPQAVFSNETSVIWTSDPMLNSTTLDSVCRFANDRLRHQRFLFLNEVLMVLRLPRTREGQMLGWMAREPSGDEYVVEFIITHRDTHENITLEFNVDGDILDKINWSST